MQYTSLVTIPLTGKAIEMGNVEAVSPEKGELADQIVVLHPGLPPSIAKDFLEILF